MRYVLDIRTLSLTAGIISLILCICMLYVSRTRKTYNGFTQWTTASILNAFGMALLSMRGFFPDFISIVIANTLIVVANCLIVYGLEVFAGNTRRIWLIISFAVSTFMLFIYFTYYSPNVNVRIVIISAVLSILFGYCAYFVHKYIPRIIDDKDMWLTTVFGILAIWFAFRMSTTLFIEAPIVNFMKSSAVQGMAFVVFFCGNIFIVTGLIILNSQRVEFDLLTAIEEVRTLRGIIPICMHCKGIRDDSGCWNQLEKYITEHSEAQFSHGICEKCAKKHYPEGTE